MAVLKRKGFVKVGVGAGLIVLIAVLVVFLSSFLAQTAAPASINGHVTDNAGGNQNNPNPNKPVLIDVNKLGDGESQNGGDEDAGNTGTEDDNNGKKSGGGFAPSGGGGVSVQCPPPTHKVCDYESEQCVVVQGSGQDECSTDSDCTRYCNPRSPGYWKNHLSIAEGLLGCVHDDYDIFDYVDTQAEITDVLECSGDCSSMLAKLKKFLLAALFNLCGGHFDLDDTHANETIEYWINGSIEEIGNGEGGMDEYFKDALDLIVNGDVECYPETHTVCDYEQRICKTVEGSGTNECSAYPDCIHTECNYGTLTCDIINSSGTNECQVFVDCPHHTVCNYDNQTCDIIEGNGTSQCSVWEDCLYCGDGEVNPPEQCELPLTDNNPFCSQTNETCLGNKLGTRDSYGYCSENCGCIDDPFNYACVKDKCGAECDSNDDCPCKPDTCIGPDYYNYPDYGVCTNDCICDLDETPCHGPCKPVITRNDPRCTRYVCDYGQQICKLVEGEGTDECSTFADCANHTVCDYGQQACIEVSGPGDNECSAYSDCVHTVCNYDSKTCDIINSTGTSECSTFQDCPQHTECDYEQKACVAVEGEGTSECEGYGDCIHTECIDGYCINTESPGDDLCETDSECRHHVCNYGQLICEEIYETGFSECSTFQDCPQHMVCNYDKHTCDIVEGNGTSQCSVWEDCLYCGDGQVNPPEQCELPGTNNNPFCPQITTSCLGHKFGTRDPYGYCSENCGCMDDPFNYTCVEGECGAECDAKEDCPCPPDGCVGPDYYDHPDYGVCTNDCICDLDETPCHGPCKPVITRNDPRCTRYVCDYGQQICKLVEGEGTDECSTFADCANHTVCDYGQQACIEVSGPGDNECSAYSDCVHTECCGMSCTVTNSPGTDECLTNADCTDYICNYDTFTCDAVAGSGYVECQSFEDCAQHTVCDYIGHTCKTVEGSGTNECSAYPDCIHNVCNYDSKTCSTVNSPGVDECSAYPDCIHTECNYGTLTCDIINSSGTNECQVFVDCPHHTVCNYDNQTCDIIEGGGTSQCSVWEDCLYCGDGQVNPPEQCELPGTNNNPFCSQTTEACSGKKLGTRDAYGYCDSGCGCIDDPFNYACVKGKCGAECDSNDDCQCPVDRCIGTDWYDYPANGECSDSCTCGGCNPTITRCDPRCMGDCKVEVWTEHHMNPSWGYPYTATDDIYIVAKDVSNGACNGLSIYIRYWWCSCPSQDVEQTAIEATRSDWSAKYDRLCSADAAYHGGTNPTHSLECSACSVRGLTVRFPEDDGKPIPTGSGGCTGTFQIDLQSYYNCYKIVSNLNQFKAVALGCAGHCEDHPKHKVCQSQTCVEVNGYGTDECSSSSDCTVQSHLQCSNMACVRITGSGTDQCTLDCDCYHMECVNSACAKVNGEGQNQCSQNSDCSYISHYECVGYSCELVPGPGADECSPEQQQYCKPLPV